MSTQSDNPHKSPIASPDLELQQPTRPTSTFIRLPSIAFGTTVGGFGGKLLGAFCFGSPYFEIHHIFELPFIFVGGLIGAWIATGMLPVGHPGKSFLAAGAHGTRTPRRIALLAICAAFIAVCWRGLAEYRNTLREREAIQIQQQGCEYIHWERSIKWPELVIVQVPESCDNDRLASLCQHLHHQPRLRLNLGGSAVDDDGLHHLHKLRNLRELLAEDTRITNKGIDSLQRALPRCRVWQ